MNNLDFLKNDSRTKHLFFMAKTILKLKKHMASNKNDLHSLRGLIILNKRFERSLHYVCRRYKDFTDLKINLNI